MGRALIVKVRNDGYRTGWDEVPPIDMLPVEYRAEAKAILEDDPSKVEILERCRACELDCWTALRLLGLLE